MIETGDTLSAPEEGDTTARLLRLAGPRTGAPADLTARVRRAVLEECRLAARRRTVHRRTLAGALVLAMAAAVVLAVRFIPPREVSRSSGRTIVATVERVEGEGPIDGPLHAGDRVETDESTRFALRLVDGASVRFDRVSRARLLSPDAIELTEGAVYVDSGRGAGGGFGVSAGAPRGGAATRGLEIRTAFGTVSDIGTQFEVRLASASVRVRVRSGLVEWRPDDRGDGEILSARPGTELTVGPRGVVRQAIAVYGPEWEWAAGLAPAFEIDGRALGAFLEYLCREQGWTLRYADATLARDVSGIVLIGPVEGLQPVDALDVVLATSGLTQVLRDGELVVAREGIDTPAR